MCVSKLRKLCHDYPGLPALFAAVVFIAVGIVCVFAVSGKNEQDSFSKQKDGLYLAEVSVAELEKIFEEHNFDVEKIKKGEAKVPRIFVQKIPKDLDVVADIIKRKQIFIKIMLPLLLKVNEEILKDRKKLFAIIDKIENGKIPSEEDAYWLEDLAVRYKAEPERIKELMGRVDIIPVSMGIAQGAEESIWGTAEFAIKGNAVFREWTWDGVGMIPAGYSEEEDKGRIKTFPKIMDSIWDYAYNINTHKAFLGLRNKRAYLRSVGSKIKGNNIMGALTSYSIKGRKYVKAVRRIMQDNMFLFLDKNAELEQIQK